MSDKSILCRLCGGNTKELFHAKVLKKYDVSYWRCKNCNSLQTEKPYWLQEAYAKGNLNSADTGAVTRNLNCQAIVYTVTRVLGMSQNASVLDFGGGNGLLCRLLRDAGFNARILDSYAINDFAQGFEDHGSSYDVVCAFEVVEHFASPKEEIAHLFERCDSIVIIGTETYRGQGADWWYLAPAGGQHLFFYTQDGMASLAAKHGFDYKPVGNTHIFLKRPFTRIEGALLSRLLSSGLRWVRSYLAFSLSYDQAVRDSGLFA